MKLNWLIFAFLGTIFFSAAGVLDKLLLSSYANDSKAYIVCQVLAQQLFTVPVILIIGVNFVYPESILALLFGGLQVLPAIFFMRALQVEEASKVTALEYVYPIFVFIGSVFLLGEMLDLKQCAGGLLLLAGTLIISYRNSDSNSSRGPMGFMALSPAIKPFLSYWILTALYYLSLKYILISIDEWHLYTWSSLGSLVAVMPLLSISSTRRGVFGFFAGGSYAIGGLISEETFQFLGLISSIFAYSLGSVSLVSSVGALQPIMTVILIIALGIITPKLAEEMKERTDRRALIQKSLSFMIVLLGIYFVS
ncbi:EamA-like transporter family protein [uncultured archaeon]|nr:EamA-like transporter family protein [uncultured archaeon]